LQAYAATSAPSTEIPIVIVLPSAAFISAIYLADCGNADAVGVAGPELEVASVDDPPEQAERVPRATNALIPTSRVRVNLFM
jgi:hypothetical protein